MTVAEQVYQYLAPSEVRSVGPHTQVMLATSGGNLEDRPAEHPRFFDGFLQQPEQAAVGLLACARVARTRYYKPPGMVAAILRAADPVVTSEAARLRFESFSACCGVYARLDIEAAGLDRPPAAIGTTNVDFNPPMREALARVAATQPVRLHVGIDDVGIRTFGGQVLEQRVPPRPHVSMSVDQRLRRSAGLASLEPLLRFASRLRVFGSQASASAAPSTSAWELTLDQARFTVALSPEVSRGFSGEGGLLFDVASSEAEQDADQVMSRMGWGHPISVERLASAAALSRDRTRSALTFLAAQGRVGYDLAEGAYFHRELPLRAEALLAMNPRLMAARLLVDSGAVHLRNGGAAVHAGDVEYHVVFAPGADRCTCPWWGRYAGARGPCKHVLAARLAAER